MFIEALSWLALPFVQRALLAGVLVAILAGLMGVVMTLRNSSFFGDTVAHSALAGVALGLWTGVAPLLSATLYAVGISWLVPLLRKKSKLSTDTTLGILLPFSMGLGVLLFALLPGYQSQLVSYLFGSVLTTTWIDVAVLAALVILTALTAWYFIPRWIQVSIDEEYAQLIGINVRWHELLYHLMLAVTIIAGVRLVGVVLINALLIIPASIARLWSPSLKGVVLMSPVVGVLLVILGLYISITMNIPTGASIAVLAGVVFFVSILLKSISAR